MHVLTPWLRGRTQADDGAVQSRRRRDLDIARHGGLINGTKPGFARSSSLTSRRRTMTHAVHKDMTIIGADGAPIGVVDHVDAHRIKLVAPKEGAHKGHSHYISTGLVATIDGNVVRLSANADVALLFEEEG
jgi:hypothetical protein